MFRVPLVLSLAACIAATIAAPAGWAWSQTYVSSVGWGPGSSDISKSGQITFNYVSFSHPWGGLPQMGSTLCNSAATSCYAWRWSNTGLITDERNISYGLAACKTNIGNGYLVYVNYCATGNG
jgi:hypothetical protein